MGKATSAGAAALAALIISGHWAAQTRPAEPSAGATTAPERHRSLGLAARIAAPWIARQDPEGSFPDYMAVRGSKARDLYGHAMMGYGLLKYGIQRNDRRVVDAGLRGLAYALDHPRPFHSIVFEKFALAAGYNLARTRVAGNPLFAALRPRWAARLRQMRPTWLGRRRSPYFNQHLVDAVTVIELARSGVGWRARPALGLASDLVNRRLPALLTARTVHSRAASATTLASDGALSYQALTLGFYARAVRLLGPRASPSARALLGRLARASWALSGPDGDVSYFGRSQGQAWALALTSYGSEVAALEARAGWASRHRALSLRTLRRLRAIHAGGPEGLYLTPAFRSDHAAAVAAQEDYVSGSAYTGLTLLGLGWVGDRIGAARARPGRLAADTRGRIRLDRGSRRFHVASTGQTWMAVRRAGTGLDLLALKVRDGVRWRDLPTASLRSRGGPVRRSAIGASGRCGVRITAPSAARWELTASLPARPRVRRRGKREVAGGRVVARYRGRGHIVLGRRSVSPAYGARVPARFSARGPAAFDISLSRCAR